jgi:hypothetical protein
VHDSAHVNEDTRPWLPALERSCLPWFEYTVCWRWGR